MKKSAFLPRAAVLLMAAAGLVWFLIPLRCHVLNAGNGAGIAVCLVLAAGALLFKKIRSLCRRSKPWRAVFLAVGVLLCAGILWSAAMTGFMFSTASSAPPEGATVVVLGSGVEGTKPSADLWERINTAAAYLKAHPNAKCIASGGRGQRESASEASVIKNSLTAEGIDPARILTEETSRDTRQNFRCSLALIDKSGLSRRLAVVTDDYHEFRACSIARSLGAEPYAVPAKTPWYILSACWAREVLALAKYFLIPG